MLKLRFVVSILALAISAPLTAMADDWPNRPIHFIVPFPAGGTAEQYTKLVYDDSDKVARLVTELNIHVQ